MAKKRLKEKEESVARLQNSIEKFRREMRSGQDSHCGLIVEVKENVVKVQTIVGEYWFKISQLYPPEVADCRFYNNSYVEPGSFNY